MATAISPALNRALRRGSVATATVAQNGHIMRPQNAQVAAETQDTSELDRVFASLDAGAPTVLDMRPLDEQDLNLDAGGANASPAPSRPRPAGERIAGASAQKSEIDQVRTQETSGSSAQPGRAPNPGDTPGGANIPGARPRTRRFGVDAGVMESPLPTRQLAQAADPLKAHTADPLKAPAGARGNPVSQPVEPSRSWSNLTRDSGRVDVINARKSMSAAKVLAPLVAAVSFHPGSAASSAERSTNLTELLLSVHQNAYQTAEGISDALKEDVPAWMVTQLMQSYAQIMGRRWERLGNVDPHSLGRAMVEVLGAGSKQVADLIRGASEDAYIEVNGPDVARYRVAVSVTNAAWTLYDWVTHERLSVDAAGEMPSEFYTYGLETSQIVNRLLVRCVDECRALVIQTDSADLRTSHMQSSINRMSQLVGAEYVAQTRQVMNWIGEEGISATEFTSRLNSAAAELDSRILPHIFEWARVNFLRIEQGAFNAIERLDEKAARAQTETSSS